jgi:hypothetical protein
MSCHLCIDSGWVIAYRAVAPLDEYAFICACPSGSRYRTDAVKDAFGKGTAKHWADAAQDTSWKLKAHAVLEWGKDYDAWRATA